MTKRTANKSSAHSNNRSSVSVKSKRTKPQSTNLHKTYGRDNSMAKKLKTKTRATRSVSSVDVDDVAADLLDHASDDIGTLIAESERENQTLIGVLEQAQHAQKSLLAAQKKLKTLETRQEAEHRKAVDSLVGERDHARDQAARLAGEHKALASAVHEAAKALRGLATASARLGDPLVPLTNDDDDGGLDKIKEGLRELAAHKGDDNSAVLSEITGRVREMVDTLAGRISLQSNRVKMLRKHIAELEGDLDKTTGEREQLAKNITAKDAELRAAAGRLKESQHTINGLEKDLDKTSGKLETQTRSTLTAEANALKERERLVQEQNQLRSRNENLDKELSEARKQLRSAERLAADLGQTLIDAGDEIGKIEQGDAPKLSNARGELAELVDTLHDAVEDDLEEAFREDVCEDLLPSTRALADILVKRHKSLNKELEQVRKRSDTSAAKVTTLAENLDNEKSAHKEAKANLVRASAQLTAAQKDLDKIGKELSDRSHELSEAKGENARLSNENEQLGVQAALAKTLKSELESAKSEIARATKENDRHNAESSAWESGLQALGRALVELAGATESALMAAGLKPEGFVGRFTRTMRRLETDMGKASDVTALLKSSLDMAEKAAARIMQLQSELKTRGDKIDKLSAESAERGKRVTTLEKELVQANNQITSLEGERDELDREARRAKDLDEVLVHRESELSTLKSEAQAGANTLKQVRGELEEIRARETATVESLGKELEASRKRLADETRVRHDTEATLADLREVQEGRIATAEVKASELEKAVESRDSRIRSLQKDLSAAAEKGARAVEERKRADQLQSRVNKAEDRVKQLEGELDEALEAAEAASEVESLRDERDELAGKLRAAERRAADAGGELASIKATLDSLKRKIEEKQTSHRNEVDRLHERNDTLTEENRHMKEKLAGLNARVRTLTSVD